MSNDRIWLQCAKCGEKILLARFAGKGGGLGHPHFQLAYEMDEHLYGCDLLRSDGTLKPSAECFRVLTECDPDPAVPEESEIESMGGYSVPDGPNFKLANGGSCP